MKVVFKKTFNDQSDVPDVSWFTCLNKKQEESVFVSDRSRWIIRREEMKQIKKYLLVPQNHRKRLECYSYQITMPTQMKVQSDGNQK